MFIYLSNSLVYSFEETKWSLVDFSRRVFAFGRSSRSNEIRLFIILAPSKQAVVVFPDPNCFDLISLRACEKSIHVLVQFIKK